MINTPSCPVCGSPLHEATCPTCSPAQLHPRWPWLGSGAILLAVALTLLVHLQRPPHPPRAPQRPPVITPAPLPPPAVTPTPLPQPVPPQQPGAESTTTRTENPSTAGQSPQEALSGVDVPGSAPSQPGPEIPGSPGKLRYASNLDLFKAVKRKDLAAVRKLLSSFPTLVKERNYKGATGMQLAAVEDDAAMVRVFLASGAEVDAKCDQYLYAGQTALHLTAIMGYTDVAALLLAHGARVDAGNFTGETPLHEAAIAGRNAMVPLLLRHGAHIDARQHDGYTPLYFAAINGHLDTVKLLVARGAKVNVRANDGTTPASFAKMLGKTDIATYLQQHGGRVKGEE